MYEKFFFFSLNRSEITMVVMKIFIDQFTIIIRIFRLHFNIFWLKKNWNKISINNLSMNNWSFEHTIFLELRS